MLYDINLTSCFSLRPHLCPHTLTVWKRDFLMSMVEYIDYGQKVPPSKARHEHSVIRDGRRVHYCRAGCWCLQGHSHPLVILLRPTPIPNHVAVLMRLFHSWSFDYEQKTLLKRCWHEESSIHTHICKDGTKHSILPNVGIFVFKVLLYCHHCQQDDWNYPTRYCYNSLHNWWYYDFLSDLYCSSMSSVGFREYFSAKLLRTTPSLQVMPCEQSSFSWKEYSSRQTCMIVLYALPKAEKSSQSCPKGLNEREKKI